MSHPFLFGLLVLTAYRITRLLVADAILDTPRQWLESRLLNHPSLQYLIGCAQCCSVYISAALVFSTHALVLPLPFPLLWWGGVAGACSLLATLTEAAERE